MNCTYCTLAAVKNGEDYLKDATSPQHLHLRILWQAPSQTHPHANG